MQRCFIERKNKTSIYIEEEKFNSATLGIIFSGEHYTIRNPLLYYSRNALFENHIDYMGIDFLYSCTKEYLECSTEEKDQIISEDIGIIKNRIIAIASDYKKIVLISKSNGLYYLRACLSDHDILGKASVILFSPGNDWNRFIIELNNSNTPAIVFAGKNDKMYNVPNLPLVYKTQTIEVHEIENADHSIEVDNNINDIHNLFDMMEYESAFIKKVIKK
jgi:hypothetical protein